MLKLGIILLLWFSGKLIAFPTENSLVVKTTTEPEITTINETTLTDTVIEEESEKKNEKEEGPTVPKIYEMKINSNITNRFATTQVMSKVKNLDKKPQEAVFAVVLPDKAYISKFVMEIGGKSYEAYVKEKEEAKKIYDTAVSRGQTAGVVEASARDSNRFTVSVNVEPQSKVVFKLIYEELLQRQNDYYELVLNIHPGQPVNNLQATVRIDETRPLKFVKTIPIRSGNEIKKNDERLDPSAEIDRINSTSATVKFNPNIEKQKQLAQGLGTNDEQGLAGQFIVQYDVERDPHGGEVLIKDGYFVHFFAPSDLTPLPKYVIFVLDTSGSMDGIRIKQLKEAMNSILAQLKPEDIFNLVSFSSSVKVWNIENGTVEYTSGSDDYWGPPTTEAPLKKKDQLPSSYTANEENIKNAKGVVKDLEAYGGTNIKNALETGIKLVKKHKDEKNTTHQPLIVFLTDGEPTVGETDPDKIISSISEVNGNARCPIFSLSFGDGADRDFLQKISLKNMGFARHIYEAADASLQLEEFYNQISSPLLSNVTFQYVSNVTNLTKNNFPILFKGSELVVAGIIDDDIISTEEDKINRPTICGWGVDGPIDLYSEFYHPVGDLERLWAYLTVNQILDARDAADNKKPLTKKALDLALRYSFVTPVTSLVVVKPNDTQSVDTEDASKVDGGRLGALAGPVQFQKLGGFVNSPLAPQFAPASAFGGGFGSYADPGFYLALSKSPTVFSTVAFNMKSEYDSMDEMTTVEDLEIKILNNSLPWFSSHYNENGTLTLPSGNYKLGLNETLTSKPPCPSNPIDDQPGFCSLLNRCSIVYPNLNTITTYDKYFCTLNGDYAGVCCPN